jgi:hypothetical protein
MKHPIFEEELNGWHRLESAWPSPRPYETCLEWFEVEVHSSTSPDNGGRPPCSLGRDLRCHTNRNQSRCHLNTVSGYTVNRMFFQFRSLLASSTIVMPLVSGENQSGCTFRPGHLDPRSRIVLHLPGGVPTLSEIIRFWPERVRNVGFESTPELFLTSHRAARFPHKLLRRAFLLDRCATV